MRAGLLPDERVTLTVDEAAKLLGVSRALAFQGVKTGAISAIRIGRRILVPVAGLHELLSGSSPRTG